MADTQTRKTADDVRNTVKGAIQTLEDGAVHLPQQAQREADRTVDKATGFATDLAEDAAERGRKAADKAVHLADEAAARGRKATRYALREVKDHPLTAVAIAAGIGAVVSLLLRRRD
jgi:ElaB/YqjD/DUF883 family membrane-anchored ribosome-binding protein